MYEYEYPKADSTASVIAFDTFKDGSTPTVRVLAIRRGKDPFKGFLALPGGFLEIGAETLEMCAGRELYEETHLLAAADSMILVQVQSAPKRDPRGHVIDHVYAVRFPEKVLEQAIAGDDAAAVELIPFDFDKMVNTAYHYNKAGNLRGGGWMGEWAFDHAFSLKHFFDIYLCNGRIKRILNTY